MRKALNMSKILIVDDEAAIRSALKEVLEYEGFAISEATDGESALKMVLKESFDLIFCDIKMPKLDGLDFLSELKKEEIIE